MTDTTSIKHQVPLTSGDFTAAEEPFALFAEWFAEAVKSEPNDPNAMSLATVDAEGLPDVRMVLMKGYDAAGAGLCLGRWPDLPGFPGELRQRPRGKLAAWRSLQGQPWPMGNSNDQTLDAGIRHKRFFKRSPSR